MPSWETSDTNLDEQHHRDFVLKQPSTVGPWVALGLGVTLLAFLGSLVYINSSSHPLRPSYPNVFYVLRQNSSCLGHIPNVSASALLNDVSRPSLSYTKVAPNALLGGQGPALPPERGVQAGSRLRPRIPSQTSAGLQYSKQQAHRRKGLTAISSYGDGPPASLPAPFPWQFCAGPG